ncbi:MAG: hypothetical protein WCI11_08060 [Candidatus Methylumidiphilus sp.]
MDGLITDVAHRLKAGASKLALTACRRQAGARQDPAWGGRRFGNPKHPLGHVVWGSSGPVSKQELSPLYTSVRGPSFRHGLPESSHKDVNLGVAIKPFSNTYATDMSPSMALDSGAPCRNDDIFIAG